MNLLDLAEAESEYVYHIEHRYFGPPQMMKKADAEKRNRELERARLNARWMPLGEFSWGFLGLGFQVEM